MLQNVLFALFVMCPYDIASELIDILITTLRKHTKNGTVRFITMPGKDVYCEILSLLVNIVNDSSNYRSCKILSSVGGSYLFGKDEKPTIHDESILFPFLDENVLAFQCKLGENMEFMVYEQLFHL